MRFSDISWLENKNYMILGIIFKYSSSIITKKLGNYLGINI